MNNFVAQHSWLPPLRLSEPNLLCRNVIPEKLALIHQNEFIDVSEWEIDQNFGTFPAGARAKEALIAPLSVTPEFLKPGFRYLLKRSQQRYPDQFWGEIIAHRVGVLLGFETPPTYAAYDRRSGVIGALVEWFYDDKSEHFIAAGDFLQAYINPEFDRKLGKAHNIEDNLHLLRVLSKAQANSFGNWQGWWLNALAFDALIGNTDRHQENWGFINSPNFKGLRLAPLFDNGTSLGQDRFPEHVRSWTAAQLDRYIANGHSHVRSKRGEERISLFEVLKNFLTLGLSKDDVVDLQSRLSIATSELSGCFACLCEITPPFPFRHLTSARIEWIERNLLRRFEILKVTLNESNSPSV